MADAWVMKGLRWEDPERIHSVEEMTAWVDDIGFIPFFSNAVPGFSVEEHVASEAWWTGDSAEDPWEWREQIAAAHQIAYGKFFDGKAGLVSKSWLPFFANARRNGWDFDGKWQSGAASMREKEIMSFFMDPDSDAEPVFTGQMMLSTDLKKRAGFGKGGEKNFPGILTGLQMELYLVIAGFKRRLNQRGIEYGMPVSVMMTPESIWGYDLLSSAYDEEPALSWQRIYNHIFALYPEAQESHIIKMIGKCPGD